MKRVALIYFNNGKHDLSDHVENFVKQHLINENKTWLGTLEFFH